ncbi:hypothetical protein GCM10007415_44900 [Parapedobacter pyrenivorans]|uniref:DUF3823 domain-containing protein n=1 Tax=Parapedobacter pyrenivorans TaxID=1305674 RepID=A0A917MFD7_9SPHI|nr:DUF3823 domain-containing protein [Parapedobacter pyrenivorans]GGH03704.1 hypothetical protein GCM10007415_44900 [Parapedobacter pyrenivorans]
MKKIAINIKQVLAIAILVVTASACELDNYDAPNAQLSGTIIDEETNELVEQDIIRGTTIKIIEHGYDPVQPQYLRVKNDGTYANTLLFANTYTIQPELRNFVQVAEQEIQIGSDTKLDFRVQPYIRVKDASIVKEGTKIVATFKLQQTVPEVVSRIGLYAHAEPIVGEPIRSVASETQLGRTVDEDETFTLVIDAAENRAALKSGSQYFFRIGAVITVPEAKFNYAPAIRLTID